MSCSDPLEAFQDLASQDYKRLFRTTGDNFSNLHHDDLDHDDYTLAGNFYQCYSMEVKYGP